MTARTVHSRRAGSPPPQGVARHIPEVAVATIIAIALVLAVLYVGPPITESVGEKLGMFISDVEGEVVNNLSYR